jgi:diguanylate cyclase (GGDEF)-like protein
VITESGVGISQDSRFVFHLVERLSKHRSSQALTSELIKLLGEFPPVEDLSIYEVVENKIKRVPNNDEQGDMLIRRCNEPEARNTQWPDSELIMDAYNRNQPICTNNAIGTPSFIYPIRSEIGPYRAIVVHLNEHSGEFLELLEQIAMVYRNLLMILDPMERDSLTGLLNRLSFNRDMEKFISHANQAATDECNWVAIMDIDRFKVINDTFGHLYGDEVLLHFAQLMRNTFRYTDFLFRFGGEEFIAVMSYTNDAGVRLALERFRSRVEQFRFPGDRHITVSIGYSQIFPDKLFSTFIDEADNALYHAKEHGRNQVIGYASMAVDEQTDIADNNVTFFES